MRTQNAREALAAVEGDPCELTAVVVQKAGRKTDAPSRRDIGQRGVVVGAVEILDPPGCNQAMLHGFQGRRRASADHQRASVEVFRPDQVFGRERVVPVRDQIDAAFKQIMHGDPGDLIAADRFKIEMKNPYSPVYMTCIEEAKKDLRAKARPELVSMPESIDAYDTVVLAYPNYWGTMPMAVFTFLERYDFSGKTILPLCTNEGSGMGSSERDLKRTCPGATVKNGLSITGSAAASAKEAVRRWLDSNGLLK